MRISLCIIARNEEKNISRCLESVRGLVDEVILVDTGSDDKTVEIAKRFTDSDKIFHFKWNGNHSDAKNFALNHASKEWILSLDADETISSRDFERIRELMKENEFMGFSLIQRNYSNKTGGFEWVSCVGDSYDESKIAYGFSPRRIVRLFRNDGRIRFEGVIHDNVGNSILKIGGKIKDTGVPIHHFGTMDISPDKIKRYIEMEKKNLRDDFFQYCQIGIQLHSIKENDEAAEFLKKSIEKNPLFPFSWLELGIIMLERKDLKEAERCLHKAEELAEHPMIYNYLGVLYGMLADYEKSVAYLKKAVDLIPLNADFHYNLGFTYLKMGMKKEAYEEMKKAIELNPAYKKRINFG